MLVRLYAHKIEIRDRRSHALLRVHARAERPGTVVLPMAERIFNPSRETRFILNQARAIGAQTQRLCEMLFAIEGRVGQRKLWGIVNLAKRYPNHFIDAACAQAMEQGVHSYRHVKAITERLVADALAALEPTPEQTTLTQQHALIRSALEYGDLFAHAAAQDDTLQGQQP